VIKTVEFKNNKYPAYITEGHAAQFIQPIAKKVCVGNGLDIGCGKEEWKLQLDAPNTVLGIDPKIDPTHDAMNLPGSEWDFIFSSHCLEHLPNYVAALEHWISKLKSGGVIFLYLPHINCEYWRPWSMPTRRHIHQFDPTWVANMLNSLGIHIGFASGQDLAYSFAVMGEKQ